MTQVTKINGIPVVNTTVTGFTYDGTDTLTISDSSGLSYNATITNIGVGSITGGTNLGGASSVFYGVNGDNLEFRTLTSTGSSVTITQFNDTVNIENAAGGGESNTASNVGVGEGVYSTKVGVDLRFRSLSGGTNVTVTQNGDTLVIDGPAGAGEANTMSSVGGGNDLYYGKSGVDLQLRTLVAGTNVTITSGATTLTINSTASGGGGSSRITGSTTTSNATPAEVDKIDTLTDNATNIVEVYIKAYESGAAEYGVWKRTLTVTSVSGTVVIREENADVDKTSSGLNANSISFTVNGSDIDIDVTGIAATTIDWESAYEIIL